MNPLPPSKCVVLVPVSTHLDLQCETSLRALEKRGYAVNRFGGCAAIDSARSKMASQALADGFEEILWIDSDIRFEPDSVERLRSHEVELVCGIYPLKGARALGCLPLATTEELVFGEEGGLTEIQYAGAGFMLTRRSLYRAIFENSQLPSCNGQFGDPLIPYFLPMVIDTQQGPHYLREDFSFCERATRGAVDLGGYLDSAVSVGPYDYGWEDAGFAHPRVGSFRLRVNPAPPVPPSPPKRRRGSAKAGAKAGPRRAQLKAAR